MKIINFCSQREGVGKSWIVANLCYFLAKMGKKIALFDATVGDWGCFKQFNRDPNLIEPHFGGYARGTIKLDQLLIPLQEQLGLTEELYLFLLKSPFDEILMSLKEPPKNEVDFFYDKINAIGQVLNLDYLFINGQLGFTRDPLILHMISDQIFSLFCPDLNDYQAIFLENEIMEKLEKPNHFFLMNQVLAGYDIDNIKEEFSRVFPKKKVVAFFPFMENHGPRRNLFNPKVESEEISKIQREFSELAKFFS